MRPMSLRITATLLAGLLLAIGGADAVTSPAASAAAPGATTIVGVASSRCIDVLGASTANRTAVVLYGCHQGENQQWTLSDRGELRVYDDTKCLDIRARGTTAGSTVQIFDCNGGSWQQWQIQTDGVIRNPASGLCLDVTARRTGNGSPLQVWTCNGGDWQKWRTSLRVADTQPPSTPANPRVSGLTCTTTTFSWDPSTDAVGVTAYDVYHDGQFMKSVSGSTLSTSLDLNAGARWGLYVNARDAAGNISQASATVPISVPQCTADTQAPTAPAGTVATASGTAVTVTWSASTDDIGVQGYDILRNGARVGTAATTSFTDSGLAASTSYSYTVIARDAQGNMSPQSPAATVQTGAACGAAFCEVTEMAFDSDIPWGLTTLPDGSVLYSRRDSQELVQMDAATGAQTVVGRVPNVSGTDGEGGLLGIAVSPTFASDGWVYVMHTSPTDNRVVRIRLAGNSLDTATSHVLLSGILRNKYHNGGRMRFGPDGKLYVSTGDGQVAETAQDIRSLSGKILRIDPDGTIPADNPFGNAVWSYGHRNPQGLAFDSRGRLWEQEFGNGIMDETNLIVRGGNYGWPACEGTSGACATDGLIAPKRTYPTGDASCSGLAIVRDVAYISCLRGARLYRAVISGDSLTSVTSNFTGTYGRLRTVEPDGRGGLWLTTSNNGDKDSVANNSDERLIRVVLGS